MFDDPAPLVDSLIATHAANEAGTPGTSDSEPLEPDEPELAGAACWGAGAAGCGADCEGAELASL